VEKEFYDELPDEEDELLGTYQEQARFHHFAERVGLFKLEYEVPDVIASLFVRYIRDHNSLILDAGVGTGLGGESLRKQGYRNPYGIDYSPQMLREAEKKNIYVRLDVMELGKKLGFLDDFFDAVISSATIGFAPPASYDELIRITKPGGYIFFSVGLTCYHKEGFRERQHELERMGRWEFIERTRPHMCPHFYDPSGFYYGFAYRVL